MRSLQRRSDPTTSAASCCSPRPADAWAMSCAASFPRTRRTAYLDAMFAAIERIEQDETVDADSLPAPVRPLFDPAVQGFLRSLFALDPAAMASAVTLPLLVVQGGEDLQVSLADADLLAGAGTHVKRRDLPSMNHVLKDVPVGDVTANMSSYADPSKTAVRRSAGGDRRVHLRPLIGLSDGTGPGSVPSPQAPGESSPSYRPDRSPRRTRRGWRN